MNLDLDIIKYCIAPLIAVTAGIVSYFYKNWKDTMEVYCRDLSHISHVLEIDILLMNFIDVSTERGRKAYDELAILPPFPHHNLGVLDETVRVAIEAANFVIITRKYSPTDMEQSLRDSGFTQLKACQEVLSRATTCIKEIFKYALLYFFVRPILQRKLHKVLRQQP